MEKPRKRLNDETPSQAASGATQNLKRQGKILPWSLQRECDPGNTLILDFSPPKLCENKFLLF